MKKVTYFLLAFMIIGSVFSKTNNITQIEVIANKVKDALAGHSDSELRELMKEHYIKWRLMTPSGLWKSAKLNKISNSLLPENISAEMLELFIDKVTNSTSRNNYLMSFINSANITKYNILSTKVAEEGHIVFPKVVTYAYAFEQLVQAMYNDYKVLESCKNIWIKVRDGEGIKEHMGVFDNVKLASVELPIKNIIKAHKTKKVSKRFAKFLLPVNITEAVLADISYGNINNAKAGWVLAKVVPYSKLYTQDSGAGPATWSTDNKAIRLGLPLSKKWADLYQTWNMTFVTKYSYWPYTIVKLIIPKVANYQDAPGNYMYNRILALYAHLHYSYFYRVDNNQNGNEMLQWKDTDLTTDWGNYNRKSSHLYKDELKKHKKSIFQAIKDLFKINVTK